MRQGFRVFLPRLDMTHRRAGRFDTKRTWLFPRYGFVALDLTRQRWRAVNGTFGVEALIMAGEVPMPVPTDIVEALQARTGPDDVFDPDAGLAPGSTVELIRGPISGQLATLVKLDGRQRADILLSLMNTEIRVRVPRDSLIAPRFASAGT